MTPLRRSIYLLLAVCLSLAAAIAVDYRTIPTHSVQAGPLDVIVVLGTPANPDGTPSPEQRERTQEGVREYRSGVARHLIVTGGAAHNEYTEARVMAQLAREQGVPAANVLEEPQARNTIQNIFFSAEIMHAHGWHTAEVVSSPSHLPRASLILAAFDRLQPQLAIAWRTDAAPWPREYGRLRKMAFYSAEASYCLRLRLFGFPRSRFLPGPSRYDRWRGLP